MCQVLIFRVDSVDEVEDEMERALSTREMSSICASFSNLNSKPQAENSKLLCSAEQLAAPGGLKTVKRPRRSARMKGGMPSLLCKWNMSGNISVIP